ncbi:MAG: hypothetical protein NZ699_01755 [Roseiflexus sp.]|nr:hypothetical protein [Roseiflexus sp.]MCS7287836.1 hypothetical protein [Roseiflexus sp.]MDW8147014.1 hypothetical protein [Roseiflexaceae bacterium]MDW8233480.1 hypothetical protein [Roseiflexaceae bacterium]
MKPFRRNRSRRRGKPLKKSAQQQSATHAPTASDRALCWLLARPSLDWLLTAALRYPRMLMTAALGVGAALAIWHIGALQPAPADTPSLMRIPNVSAPATSTPATTIADDVVQFLAAYNQASALAAARGQAALLEPYLAPDSPAWQSVAAEYARRASVGERRDASLVRWGVLQGDITSAGGWVDTQEQWDVAITVGGRIVSSRRGVLTRNRYWLRRDADGWRIVDAATTEVIR